MKLVIFCLCFIGSLFSQAPLSILSTASNGSIAVFPIDPGSRGNDLIQMFLTLTSPVNSYKTAISQVGLQTTRNGLIANVISITPTTNDTILIVQYLPTSSISFHYAVLLVEQIVAMIYSNTTISTSSTFTSTYPGGIISTFPVDVKKRAADIQNVFSTLNKAPYVGPFSSVGLQTTLAGPFYAPITNGFIPNVSSISATAAPNGTLLLVTYLSSFFQTSTIVVAPDQVYGIVYVPPAI